MQPESDDLFIYAPSFLVANQLVEGKSLGTAKQQDLMLLKNIGKYMKPDAERDANDRKKGMTVGKRKLKQVQARVMQEFSQIIADYSTGKLPEPKFKKQARNLMRTAWKDVFIAGLRAGGADGTNKKGMVKLSPGDDKWLKSAMAHEMRFLNKFLQAIVDETYKMPLPRRLGMYVDALSSFYDSARVIALPNDTLIYWVGPKDKVTCPSCRYMYVQSPFTKLTTPTVPRAGMTLCLSSCRDRLLVRSATRKQVLKREEELPSRNTMIQHLRKIKRTGKLPKSVAIQYGLL